MNAIIFLAITSAACPPCQALHGDYAGDARIEWRDATRETSELYRVKVVPTVVALRDGREIGRHTGYEGRREMERWMHIMEDKTARNTVLWRKVTTAGHASGMTRATQEQ